MISNLLAGAQPEPGVIGNPVLGPTLNSALRMAGRPAWFFQTFIPNLLTLGLIIGVLFFLFVFLIGGIQWITSGGDKNALEEAKRKITNAFVGLVILFSVFAILRLIENFFGLSIMTLDITGLAI